jgi:hypothetical protein
MEISIGLSKIVEHIYHCRFGRLIPENPDWPADVKLKITFFYVEERLS